MFPNVVDQRYQLNGTTPLEPAVTFVPTVVDLQSPRSRTWDLGLDYRFTPMWSMHVGVLDRQGRDELIVDPVRTGTTTGQLLLSSSGNSSYLGGEVAVHFSAGERADVSVSYTRSRASADLNAMANYYDTVMWPLLGRNEHAPAPTDAPNRLLARGRFYPKPKWLLLGTLDWRSGLPWSPTTDTLDFVGARNSLRFPSYFRLEAGIERKTKILKFRPWIGVRVWNALDAFLPVDVQSNLGSANFGTFYNSEYPQIRIIMRFER
jgi:hypothetical protein